MFLFDGLNPDSAMVGGEGCETGNCSVSLVKRNNKKLNGLRSASQRESFQTLSSLNIDDGDEDKIGHFSSLCLPIF